MHYLYAVLAVAYSFGVFYLGYKYGYKVAAAEQKVIGAVKLVRKAL